MKLYILQHEREDPEYLDDTKLIGIYSSNDAAEAAMRRVQNLPGFSEFPQGFTIGAFDGTLDNGVFDNGKLCVLLIQVTSQTGKLLYG